MALKQVNPEQLGFNPFEAIGRQWFLLTAGTQQTGWNTMTCSWGAAGVLWNKPSVTCYVRRSRYTLGFMEQQDVFTLSFLGDEHRKALSFCGSHSGRDCDKAKEAGLTPVPAGEGNIATSFAEAEVTLLCRKIFWQDLDPRNVPGFAHERFYQSEAEHRMFIGEVIDIIRK